MSPRRAIKTLAQAFCMAPVLWGLLGALGAAQQPSEPQASNPSHVSAAAAVEQQSTASRDGAQPSPPAEQPPLALPELPGPPQFRVRVKETPGRQQIQLNVSRGLVSLAVRDALLQDVLAALADSQQTNIASATKNNTPISITLRDVPFEDALTSIVSICGCTWTRRGNIYHVTDLTAEATLAPDVQGKQLQVFPLNFSSGEDLLQAIKTMLSPAGNAYVSAAQEDDNRRTQESLVVEDLPPFLGRIAQYIHQVDQPPRQVMIHVHVLQVDLTGNCRHGVNFTHFMQFAGNTLTLQTTGFANIDAPQAFLAELSGGNLLGLIEAIKESTDAKTLAAPKVLALNGQLARIQIGEKLGYRVLSNTQTATLESVEFLNVGVVLEVTPTISGDDQIMLEINPKVSSGQVIEETGLPNEKTSEVETDVLLRNGQGIVIGGLIQEEDVKTQSKLMFLGDLYLVGGLFQRRTVKKVRKEVIFFLRPQIVEGCSPCDPCEVIEQQRAETFLFHGPLHPNYRPYDAKFPTCFDRPCHPWLQPMHDRFFRLEGECGYQCPPPGVIEPIPAGGLPPGVQPALDQPAVRDEPAEGHQEPGPRRLPRPVELFEQSAQRPGAPTPQDAARRLEISRLPAVDQPVLLH
jgi:hypothetical protein